jgi:hypothetical protein
MHCDVQVQWRQQLLASTGLSHYEAHGSKPITVTVKKSIELSGLGLTKIYELINSGVLETTYVGKRRLITYRSLEKLLLPASPAPEAPRRRGRPRKATPSAA